MTTSTEIQPDSAAGKPIVPTTWLWLAGIVLGAAGLFFLWHDLALSAEWLLVAGSGVAAALAATGRPRFAPALPLWLGTVLALAAATWFAAGALLGLVEPRDFHPLPLILVGVLALATCVRCIFAHRHRPFSALTIIPITLSALAASLLFYHQIFTVSLDGEFLMRRLLLTLAWLGGGLGMLFMADRRTDRALASAGFLVVACATAKALAYDTTHLSGSLRVLVLAGAAGLTLASAALLGRKERA
jgi:hypothetical protein